MKTNKNNNIFGNILLCREYDGELSVIKDPFDQMVVPSSKNTSFDISLNVNAEGLKEEELVTLLLTITDLRRNTFVLLAHRDFSIKPGEITSEGTQIPVRNLEFEEGEYYVELKVVYKSDMGDALSDSEKQDLYATSEVISRAAFKVTINN